ncbi:MAG: sigma-70 family RNA polymerase sigma factor [Planctomycetota bacterium]|nr:sigma-70 family RNA polymerase sigma factor [Planctomycetota bacterium]
MAPPSDPQDPGFGELRLFDQWVQEHHQQVYTFILRMIGNPEDAADLTQDALLQTFRTKSKVDPDSAGYVKWCYTIARNLAVDYRRKKRPRAAEDEELERAVDARTLRPEEVYEHRVKSAEVREELLALPEMYREVLLLRYQTEMSYEQIAEVLEVPVTTVETRIHRAKKMLRERLERRN